MPRVPLADAAAAKGITPARLRALCAQGRVAGARRKGEGNRASWSVEVNAKGLPTIKPGKPGRPRKDRGAP